MSVNEYIIKYRLTEHGKAKIKAYRLSQQGRAAQHRAQAKYAKTPKGIAARARASLNYQLRQSTKEIQAKQNRLNKKFYEDSNKWEKNSSPY